MQSSGSSRSWRTTRFTSPYEGVLDTNVVALWAKKAGRALQIIAELGITDAYISTITYIELPGAATKEDKLKMRKFLAPFSVAPFDARMQQSAHYLCMRHQMKAKQAADFLIAAVAHAKGYTIITDNIKDFAVKDDITIIRYSADSQF